MAACLAFVMAATGCGGDRDEAVRADPSVAHTESGPVRGAVEDGHRVFSAIPYAAPPIGELRWRSPQPVTDWTETRDATTVAPACPQSAERPTAVASDTEDCLYLNVTTPVPSGRDTEKRPVLVWVHGGDFNNGAGSVYGARRLASTGDVVVVTLNYRLGALGFLEHPELGDTGNLGLEDQQAALRWVRDNIAAFGGDPGNVTLAGESAGATAVCAQLASPAAEGLFHKVILQSPTCTTGFSSSNDTAPRSRAQAEAHAVVVEERLGCTGEDVPRCLRSASPAEIDEASDGGAGFGPVFGTEVLPSSPETAFENGEIARVPVLIGMTRDEYRLHTWGFELANGRPLTDGDYRDLAGELFGDNADAVLATYPVREHGSPALAFSAAMTDHLYASPTFSAADALASSVPVHAFVFADDQPPWFRGVDKPSYPVGAFHSAELPYLFDVGYAEPLTTEQSALAEEMIGYWTGFARSGIPDGEGRSWRPYSASDRYVRSLAGGKGAR
ncbi:carboxylesterase family protein [Saccharomonospora xinjiangensis]|nr:Para-nitrobenzyl esterase [Saccharomonospora xinjiangensis]